MGAKTLAIVAALAVVAAACAGSQSYSGLVFDVDHGTASEVTDLRPDEVEELAGDLEVVWGANDVRLDGCRELYPGVSAYDFRIDEAAGFDYPADLLVSAVSFVGDIGLPVGAQRVTVSGPGAFTTVMTFERLRKWEEGPDGPVSQHESEYLGYGECDAIVLSLDGAPLGRDLQFDMVELEPDPQPPNGPVPNGTIQHLAETANWTATDDPWRTLALMHGIQPRLFAERVMLPATGWRLVEIKERIDGDCYSVLTRYTELSEFGEHAALAQYRGDCPPDMALESPVADADWTVSASVFGDAEFVDQLEWFDNLQPRPAAELIELQQLFS